MMYRCRGSTHCWVSTKPKVMGKIQYYPPYPYRTIYSSVNISDDISCRLKVVGTHFSLSHFLFLPVPRGVAVPSI